MIIVNTILDLLGCIGGVSSAIFCWFLVRPADKKLAKVQAGLARNNESISSVRNAILDSSIRLTEVKYAKIVESCEEFYRAFKNVYSASSYLLNTCSALKDLNEIHSILKKEHKLHQARVWLDLIVKDDMLTPIKVNDLTIAEIYVPNRVRQLYEAAYCLYASAIMQMALLKNGIEVKLVKLESVSTSIATVMPEHKELLERFGTSVYATIMDSIGTLILNEIRKTLKNEAINVSTMMDINHQYEKKAKLPQVPDDLAIMRFKNDA